MTVLNAVKPSVHCACGAQWHGQWVTRGALEIAAHMQRWQRAERGCGQITHDEFTRHYRCHCRACVDSRKRPRP
jgi:hypothetical protein